MQNKFCLFMNSKRIFEVENEMHFDLLIYYLDITFSGPTDSLRDRLMAHDDAKYCCYDT